MSVKITVTDPLAEQLRVQARRQHLQLEDLVFSLLKSALQPLTQEVLSPEEVVEKIKATPPSPRNFRPATDSLLEALCNAPDYADFNHETWEKEWADVERDIKAVVRANDIAEGRR